ncbi:hypothetical protein [Mesorhizobium sp. M0998]|uniref:hypothetical protein n=1 Tax=Mesorhizobium sp. M0998 TaxID=2957044 RepID=UPI00333C7F22
MESVTFDELRASAGKETGVTVARRHIEDDRPMDAMMITVHARRPRVGSEGAVLWRLHGARLIADVNALSDNVGRRTEMTESLALPKSEILINCRELRPADMSKPLSLDFRTLFSRSVDSTFIISAQAMARFCWPARLAHQHFTSRMVGLYNDEQTPQR